MALISSIVTIGNEARDHFPREAKLEGADD